MPTSDHPANQISTLTFPAEVLVKLPFGPPLPATLADPDTYPVFLDGTSYWGNGVAAFPLFRKPIAVLVGLHLEAFYGRAQVDFQWDGDYLAIEDDPWDLEPGPQPRPVYPDADGRYLVDRSWWTTLSPEEEVQFRRRHGAALTALESGSGPYDTEDIVALLADRPGARPDFPARVRELVQAHNWADMASGHHRNAPPANESNIDSVPARPPRWGRIRVIVESPSGKHDVEIQSDGWFRCLDCGMSDDANDCWPITEAGAQDWHDASREIGPATT